MFNITTEKYTVELFYRNGFITSIALNAKSYDNAADKAIEDSRIIGRLHDHFTQKGQTPTYGWSIACGIEGLLGRRVVHKRYNPT